MAIKSEIFRQTVKKRGLWNFKEFYNFCYEWFKSENYILIEDDYQDKHSDAGQEIILKWRAYKKVTDYFKFWINVEWHILGMNSAEIERDGKKEKTNKGEVKIKVTAELEKDYEERWESRPYWKFMRGVYEKYIIRTTVDEYEDRLIEKVALFVSDMKAYLELN